ncbi:MAG: hypothetical protein ABSE73_07555 [Planctomycetota bacterium]
MKKVLGAPASRRPGGKSSVKKVLGAPASRRPGGKSSVKKVLITPGSAGVPPAWRSIVREEGAHHPWERRRPAGLEVNRP